MDISSFRPDKKINLLRYETYNSNYAEKFSKNKNITPINDSIEFYKNANKKIEQELTLKFYRDCSEKSDIGKSFFCRNSKNDRF